MCRGFTRYTGVKHHTRHIGCSTFEKKIRGAVLTIIATVFAARSPSRLSPRRRPLAQAVANPLLAEAPPRRDERGNDEPIRDGGTCTSLSLTISPPRSPPAPPPPPPPPAGFLRELRRRRPSMARGAFERREVRAFASRLARGSVRAGSRTGGEEGRKGAGGGG